MQPNLVYSTYIMSHLLDPYSLVSNLLRVDLECRTCQLDRRHNLRHLLLLHQMDIQFFPYHHLNRGSYRRHRMSHLLKALYFLIDKIHHQCTQHKQMKLMIQLVKSFRNCKEYQIRIQYLLHSSGQLGMRSFQQQTQNRRMIQRGKVLNHS